MLQIFNLSEQPEHIQQLARWHHDQWSHLYPGEMLQHRIDKMQAYLDNNFIPSTFVAFDEELLGSAAIIESDMETRPELSPWLASVYVDVKFRKQGIGTALVRHVTDQASMHATRTLYLFTPDQQSFYRRLGWRDFDTERYHGEQVTIMRYQTV